MLQHWSGLRFPLLGLGMLSLLVAIWTGLLRLGWAWPIGDARLLWAHGPLMVCGFLGTLIGVERAVALQLRWPYGVPLLNGLGVLGLLLGLPTTGCMLISSVGLLATYGVIWQRQWNLAMATMTVGALLWVVGNGLWLTGVPLAYVVPWWMGFLVLTVAGERLELSQFVPATPYRQVAFLLAIGLWLLGSAWSLVQFASGVRVLGASMLTLAAWLWRFDLARRTVHRQGLTRYMAVCLLSSYGWLALSGLLHLYYGGLLAGPAYDAMLHALFLGCIMTMVFAHGPIIVPAILGRAVPYHIVLYVPVSLLHLSLLLRLSGDLAGWALGRQWGGLGNGIALCSFFITMGALLWPRASVGTVARGSRA